MTGPDPADLEGTIHFARTALRERQEAHALPVVADAARRHPDSAQLSQMLGSLHHALGEIGEAIAAYDRAAALAPDDAEIARLRARAHLEAGRPASALFAQARSLAPGDRAVHLGLVTAILNESGPAAAIAELERGVADAPGWVQGHAQLARLRRVSGDPDFARSFADALALAPTDVALWAQYLASLMFAGRHEQVLAEVARGRAAAGRHPLFDLSEAVAHDDLGDPGRAAPLFEAFARSGDPAAATYRLRHLLRTGRHEQATALAEQWAPTAYGDQFLPYLSLCWRLTGDPRWPWLEGDPRLIGVYDLGGALGPIEDLAALLRSLHRAEDQPLDQSVRGGTQADTILTRLEPEIGRARAAIVAAIGRHIRQLPPRDEAHPFLSAPRDRPVRITGSWSVRLRGEGHHVAHVHPGGWLSSVFYVALPDEAERGPAPAGWLSLGEPPADLGLDLPPLRLVEPRPGRLVLFPATMWHATRPFAAGERLTMAFDVARPA
jgi:Flp pilus assembly protein TadD